LIAKRRHSVYESDLRSGAWQKMRINQGQELVIGGLHVRRQNLRCARPRLLRNRKLLYASRTRNGFTPSVRQELLNKMKPLRMAECPFTNLLEPRGGRWGSGFTAAKMKDCVWLLCRMRHSAERF
jgi:bifunctional non-homologous end joining protein LigD